MIKEIANARPVALRLQGLISNVGSIRARGFRRIRSRSRQCGEKPDTMAENSEDQVLALLLTSSFLKDDRVRERCPK